jgi:hypothetical protein
MLMTLIRLFFFILLVKTKLSFVYIKNKIKLFYCKTVIYKNIKILYKAQLIPSSKLYFQFIINNICPWILKRFNIPCVLKFKKYLNRYFHILKKTTIGVYYGKTFILGLLNIPYLFASLIIVLQIEKNLNYLIRRYHTCMIAW